MTHHLCECGEVSVARFGSAWVCAVCLERDTRRKHDDKAKEMRAKRQREMEKQDIPCSFVFQLDRKLSLWLKKNDPTWVGKWQPCPTGKEQ